MRSNAVELTVGQAWFIADATGAGSLPWVLAITQPYSQHTERTRFTAERVEELRRMGIVSDDESMSPAVAEWVRVVCRAERWLDLRFVAGAGDMLRGIVARLGGRTVVALRSGALVTLTQMDIDHPHALVPVLAAGLTQRKPAQFEQFSLPAQVGARADERLRNGAPLAEIMDFLGIPESARPVVTAAYAPGRSYVEIVAGEHRDGHRVTTDVGVSVVDTVLGRVLVSPSEAFDGEWISTFAPGTPLATAAAVERLNAMLPGGAWFPALKLLRDFDETAENQREEHRREEQCPTTL